MWDKRDDMIVYEEDPFNAESPRAALSTLVTATDGFYSRNHGPIPQLDTATYRLRVDGLVDHPLVLDLDELKSRFEVVEQQAVLQCAGNRRADFLPVRDIPGEAPWGPGATSAATWTGVRLADVLAEAGVQPGAAHVAFDAPDVSQIADPPQPYGSSIVLHKATAPEVLIAWGMNGDPLPAVHGGPVRIVVPGYIGARSVKWVQRITVQAEPSDNYFQAVAYQLLPAEADPKTARPGDGLPLGAVALNADVLRPDPGSPVTAGRVEVAGYAYAGDDRGIARVDVSTDGGSSWEQAELDSTAGPWMWAHWHATVTLEAGRREVTVRAWDTTGASQPEDSKHLWNPKGYVNNAWARVGYDVVDGPA